MLKKSCSNKQGDKLIPWDDIVRHNPAQDDQPNENKNDYGRGTFGRMELLFGRIRVSDQAGGVVWECNICDKTTEAKKKLRNHLTAMRRKTNTGEVYCPYCNKEHKHMGNLKAHITGFVGGNAHKYHLERLVQKYGMKLLNEIHDKTRKPTIPGRSRNSLKHLLTNNMENGNEPT